MMTKDELAFRTRVGMMAIQQVTDGRIEELVIADLQMIIESLRRMAMCRTYKLCRDDEKAKAKRTKK